jgi:hypothetical protein
VGYTDSDRNLAAGSLLDLVPNRHARGGTSSATNGEKYHVLNRTQASVPTHTPPFYTVDFSAMQTCVLPS